MLSTRMAVIADWGFIRLERTTAVPHSSTAAVVVVAASGGSSRALVHHQAQSSFGIAPGGPAAGRLSINSVLRTYEYYKVCSEVRVVEGIKTPPSQVNGRTGASRDDESTAGYYLKHRTTKTFIWHGSFIEKKGEPKCLQTQFSCFRG